MQVKVVTQQSDDGSSRFVAFLPAFSLSSSVFIARALAAAAAARIGVNDNNSKT
jgi:hypothetical protein